MRENPRRVSEKEQQEKKNTRKGKRPNTVREPGHFKEAKQQSLDKRAARWAIRRELPEQMPASGADVKSKAHKLTS